MNQAGSSALRKHGKNDPPVDIGKRKLLARLGKAASWLALGPGPLRFTPPAPSGTALQSEPAAYHLHPQYAGTREVDRVLERLEAGSDEFTSEKYHDRIAAVLGQWRLDLIASPENTGAIRNAMHGEFRGGPAVPRSSVRKRPPDSGLDVEQLEFAADPLASEDFLDQWRSSMGEFRKLITVEFEVTRIRPDSARSVSPDGSGWFETVVRYELVGTGTNSFRQQRVGNWSLDWEMPVTGAPRLRTWTFLNETRGRSVAPVFKDITPAAFAGEPSFTRQFATGTDEWRGLLDGACGIDIYGHHGVSVGDIDGDGFDDLYICQPAGLPNRLYRNRGDGTFLDMTETSGVGLLDNTACALFADLANSGRQDLVVVRAGGPLLFLNEGHGKFRLRPGAFQFASPPQGTFTGAAIADYDRDGWLDIYFCLYSYYQGADQYRYPTPYFDARNGPPNFLMRNGRDGTFRDVTQESGLHVNNNRFSFCCAWGDLGGNQGPDLYVVNDFGRKNLYRNNGDGTFTDIAAAAGVEDTGAGMSVCWRDLDGDRQPDLYVANMWSAAGERISDQELFQKDSPEAIRAAYRKHAMGNSLYRSAGGGRFDDETGHSGTAVGRWAWSSDSWDFDHDGFPDLYVTNGMISGSERADLNSFFWRQVVARSPNHSRPTRPYELGWNAINELIRSGHTWSGFERNIFYRNNRDGTFSDVSGIVGLDFIEDGRSFALADFDQDGRVELLLKNRSKPQVRLLANVQDELPPAIAFRLEGTKSNRDAIGAAVTVKTGSHSQTRFVEAGSGFLAQHSKELVFGLGREGSAVNASIRWPSGLLQELVDLPPNHRIHVREGSPPSRIEPFRETGSRAGEAPASRSGSSAGPEPPHPPRNSETWLLVPVPAPDFSAKDPDGAEHRLSLLRGNPVVLYFLHGASASLPPELRELEKCREQRSGPGPRILVLVADGARSHESVPSAEDGKRFSFPILQAPAEPVAVYNLLFRSLFDRHCDMSLPTGFLLDEQGAIVKIYQGLGAAADLVRDSRNIPRTTAARLRQALPFAGVGDSYEFGRNYLSYGSLFFERGYLAPAETFFLLALEDDPSGAEAHYGLGSVYLAQERNAEARTSFERASQSEASYPGTLAKTWNNLGILEARENRTEQAVANFEKALELDPRYATAIDNLGNAYRQAREWENAKEAFGRALALDAEDPEANYGLGMVSAQLDDTGAAREFLLKALAARPRYPEALNNLGILYLRTGHREEAERSFRESIRVAPEFDPSYLNLARLYALEGDAQSARAVLLALLALRPGQAQALKELSALPL